VPAAGGGGCCVEIGRSNQVQAEAGVEVRDEFTVGAALVPRVVIRAAGGGCCVEVGRSNQVQPEAGCQPLRGVANYKDVYKLTYVRGPSGILVMLAEELKND
jgi:porphobilinogen deaminase